MLGVAGSADGLIALGLNLFRFEVKGGKLSILVMCALKLLALTAAAFGAQDCSTCRQSPPASSCCSR